MKFILSEDNCGLQEKYTFLLEERFILQEASITDVAKQWTEKLDSTLDKTEKILQLYIKYSAVSEADKQAQAKRQEVKTELENTTEELTNALSLPFADLAAGKVKVDKELLNYAVALDKIDEVIPKTDDNEDILTLIDKRIAALTPIRTASNPFAGGDKNFKTLQQIITWVSKNAMPLFDIESDKKDAEKFKKFHEICNECIELVKDLRVDLPDDFSDIASTDLKPYCELVKEALEANNLNTKDITTNPANLRKAITLDSYIPSVTALRDAFNKLSKSPVLNPNSKQDWKTKYANAVNKEAVIKEFIYTTWKNDSDEVLPLSKALLKACEVHGFNTEGENANPFISYISNVYLKYSLNPDLYNIIHNLVANNLLDSKDLMGKGDMGLGNLIFCKALYAAGANAIKLYIQKQYKILHATTVPSEFGSAADLTFNILYKLPKVETDVSTKKSNDLSLRSIAEIEDLEEKWLGEVSEVSADDPNTHKTSTAPTADLIKQIDSTENAVKVLATLAIKFSSNDKIVQAVQSCKEAKQLMDTATTLEKIQKLVASVERLYQLTHINATQALNLIKSILESDKFDLTKE